MAPIKTNIHDVTGMIIRANGPLSGDSAETSTTTITLRNDEAELVQLTLFYNTATGLPITTL